LYWVALFNPKDTLHRAAISVTNELENSTIVTTEAVFSEVLNQFSVYGTQWRTATEIENLLAENIITVVPTNHELFVQALILYKSGSDKSYTHVDCISMIVMRNDDITEILTSDHHFKQEGFTLLFK
jgi:predicted nucleic acid-binding protein